MRGDAYGERAKGGEAHDDEIQCTDTVEPLMNQISGESMEEFAESGGLRENPLSPKNCFEGSSE